MSQPPIVPAVTLELTVPIVVSGAQVHALAVRRPTVADNLTAVRQGHAEKLLNVEEDLRLYASLTGLTPADLMQLDMADYLALQEIYANFLKRTQKTSAGQ